MPNHTNVNPLPRSKKAVLIGNPNIGKSLIFGCLTSRYVTVSNYPGTTVEITLGKMKIGSEVISLIDAPGINSLTPISEDGRVLRDILLKENIPSVIQVVDAKNLERGLYITTQPAEMSPPFPILSDYKPYDSGFQPTRHGYIEYRGYFFLARLLLNLSPKETET
jgi:Fe2+ transport system protein B